MIASVSFEKTTFNSLPFKFEAGTPDFVGTAALATALNYVTSLGLDNIARYEQELLQYATDKLLSIPGLRIFGNAQNKRQCDLISGGWNTPLRYGHPARQNGDRRAYRSPLCRTADAGTGS